MLNPSVSQPTVIVACDNACDTCAKLSHPVLHRFLRSAVSVGQNPRFEQDAAEWRRRYELFKNETNGSKTHFSVLTHKIGHKHQRHLNHGGEGDQPSAAGSTPDSKPPQQRRAYPVRCSSKVFYPKSARKVSQAQSPTVSVPPVPMPLSANWSRVIHPQTGAVISVSHSPHLRTTDDDSLLGNHGQTTCISNRRASR